MEVISKIVNIKSYDINNNTTNIFNDIIDYIYNNVDCLSIDKLKQSLKKKKFINIVDNLFSLLVDYVFDDYNNIQHYKEITNIDKLFNNYKSKYISFDNFVQQLINLNKIIFTNNNNNNKFIISIIRHNNSSIYNLKYVCNHNIIINYNILCEHCFHILNDGPIDYNLIIDLINNKKYFNNKI